MTTPAPWTQTITLNADDHPIVIYADRLNDGTWAWRFQMRPDVMARPGDVKAILLELNQETVRWFTQDYTGTEAA